MQRDIFLNWLINSPEILLLNNGERILHILDIQELDRGIFFVLRRPDEERDGGITLCVQRANHVREYSFNEVIRFHSPQDIRQYYFCGIIRSNNSTFGLFEILVREANPGEANVTNPAVNPN